MNPYSTLITALLVTMTLGACSDGSVVGGGAGDTDNGGAIDSGNQNSADLTASQAVDLILPFVGLYRLPGNWAGVPESDAYLNIQEPNTAGVAPALLYRTSGVDNCVEPQASQGQVEKDPFSQRVFLNNLATLGDAILSREDTSLVITLSDDFRDVNNDGVFSGTAVLAPALKQGFMASDLSFCQ